MKVVIMTDLEGISGVDSIDMMDESGNGYQEACRRLMADTNAAVQGAIDAGASEILVYDGHGSGKNFLFGGLDSRAKQFWDFNASDLWDNCAAYLEIGLHAKAGTMDAFLEHTQSSVRWYNYYINGKPYGELVQGAAYCGAYGVPMVMVSGDKAACAEAAELISGIECAVVKQAIGRNHAESIALEEAEQRIREAARRGICKAAEISPFRISLPAELRVEYCRVDYCEEMLKGHPERKRLDSRSLMRTITKIETYNDLLP